MENPFSRLLKVLMLERKQGYRNKAVIGGLDKFASRWEAEAREACGNQALVNEMLALMLGYPAVEGQAARERIVEQITRRAREAEASAAEASAAEAAATEAAPADRSTTGVAGGAAGVPPAGPQRPVEKQGAGTEGAAGPGESSRAGERGQRVQGGPERPAPAPRPILPHSSASEPARGETGPGAAQAPTSGSASGPAVGPARAKPAWNKPEQGAIPNAAPGQAPDNAAGAGASPMRDQSSRGRGPGPTGSGVGAGAGDRPRSSEPGGAASRSPEKPSAPPRREEPRWSPPARPEADLEPDDEDDLLSQLFDLSGDEYGMEGDQSGSQTEPGGAGQDDEQAADPLAAEEPETPLSSQEAGGARPASAAAGPEGAAPTGASTGTAGTGAPAREHREAWSRYAESLPGHGLDAPVTRLPSIGPSFAEKLAKLGVETVRDLLYLMPHRYEDYSALRTIDRLHYGDEVTVVGTVWHMDSRPLGGDRRMVTAVIGDGTGEMQVTWFNPYVERQLREGRAYLFSGKIDSYRGQLQMRSPEFEPLDSLQIHTARLVPIYPLTQGLNARWLRRVMKNAVDSWAGAVPDPVPASIRQELGLLPLPEALANVHFPENQNLLAAGRRRLSFDEFFVLQLGVLRYRHAFRAHTARPLQAGPEIMAPFLAALPFAMTGAQQRAMAEITADLSAAEPMSRLLQGDVGSGKTAVAAAALWAAVANGTQAAIMAPTEILAEQHARSFGRLFEGLVRPDGQPMRIGIFTGRQPKAEREEALAGLAAGEIDIAVGTHALIQEGVTFHDLTVAVVDEQHRFGVEQRAALRQKGTQPHMLVMSATPIPRSLALTLYGDLDVSVIDEMPAGRTPIKTKWLTSTYRERAYNFIRRQAAEGHQAFIIYPLVEGSDHSDAKAAVEEHARLQREVFPDLRLGLLHGRMKGDEKDAVMRAFAAGDLQVLVATSVVEVGIDVPNATMIVIEGAERFGLAQLHQFRGRVGRGEFPSYCVLISDAEEGGSAQRLEALETSNDGFALAQIDLEMRGPGDFLGTRQSGLPPLQMAQLSDLRTLEEARGAAQKLFSLDPDLTQPEHRLLAERVAEFWHGTGDVS